MSKELSASAAMDEQKGVSIGHRGDTLRWAAAGFVSGLALSGGMLGMRLITGVPSLPEIVQDRLLELLPGDIVGLLIDRLQFWGKPLLLAGWLTAQVVAGTLVAVAFGRLAARRHVRWAADLRLLTGALVGLLFWAAVELAAFPALGLGLLGREVPHGITSAGWSVLPFVGYGLLVAGFGRLLQQVVTHEVSAARRGPALLHRRQAIALLLASGAASLAGGTFWRVVALMGERGTPASTTAARATETFSAGAPALTTPVAAEGSPPHSVETAVGTEATTATAPPAAGPAATAVFASPPGISSEITSTDQFYVVTRNFVDPTVSTDGWSLEVTGLVERQRRYSYADLLALPAADTFVTLECISNLVGGDLISNTRWTGVPLGHLLDQVGVQDGAAWVVFKSEDNYKESLPLDVARQPNTLLAYHMNGAPLPDKHGFPLRLLSTGRYGMKNPKWLARIELVASPISGTWERSGWNPDKGVESMARFDTRPEQVRAGTAILLGGVAFTGDRGISSVEVSEDGGTSWTLASTKMPLSPHTWVLWSYRWKPGRTGDYTLLVRAVDGSGTVQTDHKRRSYPTGATGYHAIQVQAG